MKIKYLLLISVVLCLSTVASAAESHRYYFNPFYQTDEFSKSYTVFPFSRLPKLDQAQAMNHAESAPMIKKILEEDANYFLYPMASSYTDDDGKNWSDWEVGVAKIVMNQTMRVDAVFGINPFDGKVSRLSKPIISMPFTSDESK